MNFVTQANEFAEKLIEIDSALNKGKHFPEQVFREKLSKFVIINFDEIFTESFFQQIKSFLIANNESSFNMAVLEPDPQNYFFYHFKKFPIIEVSVRDSYEDYILAITEDPGGSPADAIRYNSTVVVLYSNSLDWIIYADRDYEIGVVAFTKAELMETFISTFDMDKSFSGTERIKQTLEIVYSNVETGVSKKLLNQFIKNYTSSVCID